MMVEKFKTIQSQSEFLWKEKASKFYGFAIPVQSMHEVENALLALRKKYFDSRHVCYAYVLGPDKKNWRVNDAGEPSNSAGKPILGQINAFDLTNVLVVVVRYFGGTKLGVGGLIQAYKQTAYETLRLANVVEVEVQSTFEATIQYENLDAVLKQLKFANATVLDHKQEELNHLIFTVPNRNKEALGAMIHRLCLTLKPHE